MTLHYITLHYITLHYISLHYITFHYSVGVLIRTVTSVVTSWVEGRGGEGQPKVNCTIQAHIGNTEHL
uniref:Uncharacterized protein n=1 Tax=Anguilla anguilla TaxID=7936 RepID=A0A0E9T164_ANGAN